MLLRRPRAIALGHQLPPCRVGDQLRQRIRETFGIPGGDEDPDALTEVLRRSPVIGGDHRQPRGHTLENPERARLGKN